MLMKRGKDTMRLLQGFHGASATGQKALLQSQLHSNAQALELVADKELRAVSFAAESLRHKVPTSPLLPLPGLGCTFTSCARWPCRQAGH